MTGTNDETKTVQIKPLSVYSHMPPHIKETIIKFADPFINENLRRVSKEFKALCDASPTKIWQINVIIFPRKVEITIRRYVGGSLDISFSKGFSHTYIRHDSTDRREYQGCYCIAAAEFLHKITKYKNYRIGHLQIAFDVEDSFTTDSSTMYSFITDSIKEEQLLFFHHFLMLSETLQHKFHLGAVFMKNHRSHEDAARLVALCEPRTLRSIKIWGLAKLAKKVCTRDIDMTDDFSHFDHYEDCSISMNVLTVDVFKKLIENFRNNTAVRYRHIDFQRKQTTEEMKALEEYYRSINSDNRIELSNSSVTWTKSNLSLDMRRVALGQR